MQKNPFPLTNVALEQIWFFFCHKIFLQIQKVFESTIQLTLIQWSLCNIDQVSISFHF